jgi:hypothetical protein
MIIINHAQETAQGLSTGESAQLVNKEPQLTVLDCAKPIRR